MKSKTPTYRWKKKNSFFSMKYFDRKINHYLLFFSIPRVGVGWWEVYAEGGSPGTPILVAYQGFVRGQFCPFSRPNLSYIAPCPITFWFSLAKLRSTRLMEETCKTERKNLCQRQIDITTHIFSSENTDQNIFTDASQIPNPWDSTNEILSIMDWWLQNLDL